MNWNFFNRNNKIYPADLYSKEYKNKVFSSIEEDNEWIKFPITFSFLLTSSDNKRVRTAGILHKCVENFYQDKKNKIFDIYQKTKYEHAKYNAAVLLCSLHKWDSIQYIIRFYVNKKDNTISQLGKLQLVKWLENFNRTFHAPNNVQVDSIQHLLIEHGNELTS